MSYQVNIRDTTVSALIEALLLLPPHVRKYRVETAAGITEIVDHSCFLLIDDNAERVDVIACKKLRQATYK